MNAQTRRCKCLHCKKLFIPDYRNRTRQKFCKQPECQHASRRQSQRAWLEKPGNHDYFREPDQAARVRQWQKEHPDYWKSTARYRKRTLQEPCSEQVTVNEAVIHDLPDRTLQDLCSMQIPLFVGLISMLTGSTLQEDIVGTGRHLVTRGHDILGMVPGMNLERSLHEKTCPQSGSTPESACAV